MRYKLHPIFLTATWSGYTEQKRYGIRTSHRNRAQQKQHVSNKYDTIKAQSQVIELESTTCCDESHPWDSVPKSGRLFPNRYLRRRAAMPCRSVAKSWYSQNPRETSIQASNPEKEWSKTVTNRRNNTRMRSKIRKAPRTGMREPGTQFRPLG